MIDPRERWHDPEEALRLAMDSHAAELWTSMPGIIQSFNPSAMTATVQISIKGVVRDATGKAGFVNMPLLVDVPVYFPRGGGCTFTFPVAAQDECLVVFADRCIDAWWQSGGIQVPMEPRKHDLSDGFAFVGFPSQPNVLSGFSTSSAQLRSNDGSTYIDLNPTSKAISIVAPGGLTVTAPTSTFSGAVTVKGLFTFIAGMAGSAFSGAAMSISGVINLIGSFTVNGKRVDDTHTHTAEGANAITSTPN